MAENFFLYLPQCSKSTSFIGIHKGYYVYFMREKRPEKLSRILEEQLIIGRIHCDEIYGKAVPVFLSIKGTGKEIGFRLVKARANTALIAYFATFFHLTHQVIFFILQNANGKREFLSLVIGLLPIPPQLGPPLISTPFGAWKRCGTLRKPAPIWLLNIFQLINDIFLDSIRG